MKKSDTLAVIILAAGTSSRLGEPKQLVMYQNESLLKNTVNKALEITRDVFVVLGHENNKCEKELKDFDVTILYNEKYKKGIGSSLSFGINYTKAYENTMIMLCDQPLIPISHYKTLTTYIKSGKICASFYNHSLSVPAIFPQKYYEKLLLLNPKEGAKSILKSEKCIKVPLLKNYSIDIDTLDDIAKYLH